MKWLYVSLCCASTMGIVLNAQSDEKIMVSKSTITKLITSCAKVSSNNVAYRLFFPLVISGEVDDMVVAEREKGKIALDNDAEELRAMYVLLKDLVGGEDKQLLSNVFRETENFFEDISQLQDKK